MSSTLYLLTHSMDYLLELIAGIVLLLTWRSRPDRSRIYLGCFFICSIGGSVVNILFMLLFSTDNWQSLMFPASILTGFPIFFLLMLYLSECMRPGYFTFRRGMMLFSPWILFLILNTVVCSITFTPIDSLRDLPGHLDCLDVWIRLLTLGMYLPYAVWLLRIPDKWSRSDMSRPMLRAMCWITATMTITFIGAHGLHLWLFDSVHLVLYVAITLLSLYSEFYDRLSPPQPKESTENLDTNENEASEEKEDIIRTVETQIRKLMEEEELWREPEMKQDDFIRRVGTNRIYMSRAIQNMGYDGYKDYINHMRVQYMCQKLSHPNHESIQSICYEAGYRSRGSAWRNFAAIVGLSPQEYAKSHE